MKSKFSIQGFEIGGSRTFIIAEAGVNHNGDIDLAKKLIDEAKKAKVDAIKFQTFITEELVTDYAPKANYQRETTLKSESQLEMIKKLELSFEAFQELKEYSDKKKILFLSTPFDLKSVELLVKLDIPAFKISSGDINNTIMLERIALEKKPILLSTGMTTFEELFEIIVFLKQLEVQELLVFHCITSYPAPFSLLNLRLIPILKNKLKIPIGFSDHSTGIKVPPLAVASGANAIEKHFTLDKNLPGPDHKASIEPEELKNMVEEIRFTEKILGSAEREISEKEFQIRNIARKSVVVTKNMPKGFILTRNDLSVKRPGNGIPPKYLNQIIGKKTKIPLKKDMQLSWEFLEN